MKSDEPGRAQGKELSSSGGGVAIRGSSSGEQLLPDNSGDNATSNLVPSQPVSSDADSPTLVDATLVSPGVIAGEAAAGARGHRPQSDPTHSGIASGTVIAQRYQILDVLGEGGMGAVYKANDRELNRTVALKVIRPELARNPAIVERFKQELRLSHQVTHKNVIRIYDLGEGEGIKFITMEYIEGKDLRSLIREKKRFAPEETVEVIQQVCQALDAAHSVGVIHRDLKPQNIMQDRAGRILVMDFGLARTLEGDGMTQTGALVGTMEYMSPEQALGKELDQRSDIFSLGLICYELLTGKTPFLADSALASLIKRTQERAVPVSDVDAQIPGALSGIVSKCLERDLSNRYQSVSAVLADLNTWKDKRAAGTIKFNASVKPWGQTLPWPLMTGIVTALALAISGYMLRDRLFKSSPSTGPAIVAPTVSLAILPFRNASGDPGLDWLGSSMAEMLSTDVGQSSSLRTVSTDRVHQILRDLRIQSDATLDNAALGRLGEFSNADEIVWGQYARFGDIIRIDATLRDLKQQRSIGFKAEAPNEKELLKAVDQLARSIQQNLNLPSDSIEQLRAAAFKPSSTSVQALRNYSEGMGLERAGKHLEAVKRFQASTQEDANFASAYARLAEAYAALGYGDNAAQASQKAVELSENLGPQEKYRIQAINARISSSIPEAIKAYEALAKIAPGDSDVQSNLAELYQATGASDKAREVYAKLLASDPKNMNALLGMGRAQIASGDAQSGLDHLNRALSLTVQLDNDEEKAAVLQSIGAAYRDLNKPDDALNNFRQSLEIRRRLGDKGGIAATLTSIARVQAELIGKTDNALKSYQEALQLHREIGDKRGIGDTLLSLGVLFERRGQYEQALKDYKDALEIQREVGNIKAESQCLNNIGSRYYNSGDYEDALTYFQQALEFREKLKIDADISETLHNLAETSTRIGQFDQALGYYMRALDLSRKVDDKLGVAIESHSLGTLFEYQGRYSASLKSKEDAVSIVRSLDDKFWRAAIFSSYGHTLASAGRYDEAQKTLEEALKLAREVKSEPLIAQTLSFQGDLAYYRGDARAADALFNQALQSASRSKDLYVMLMSKIDLAKAAIRLGRSSNAITTLKNLLKETDDRRLKYLSAQCSLYLGEALLTAKDYKHAQTELESAVRKSQALGARTLLAQSHGLLAKSLAGAGDAAEASRHQEQAKKILDEIGKELQSNTLLSRGDLAQITSIGHQ
jgi:serine/threonine protein kinase/tetratricopeptide (TPR) repeat protein